MRTVKSPIKTDAPVMKRGEAAQAMYDACIAALLFVPMMRPERCTEADRLALITQIYAAVTAADREALDIKAAGLLT